MTIDAVLFDMDGLLFDSETLAIEASALAAGEQGMSVGDDLFKLMLGTNKEKSTALFLEHFPALDAEKFWIDFDIFMWRQVDRGGLPVKPYAGELLQWVKGKGLKMGLCSGSPRHVVDGYLRVSGMGRYFSAILAGDDDPTLLSKPAPDMYLRTAAMLDARPAYCLVLEDSPNGLRAGRDAGMKTIMVPDLVPYSPELAPVCDAVFPDLSHVPAFIENLSACR